MGLFVGNSKFQRIFFQKKIPSSVVNVMGIWVIGDIPNTARFTLSYCYAISETSFWYFFWYLFTKSSHYIHKILTGSELWKKYLTELFSSSSLIVFFDRKFGNDEKRLRRIRDQTRISLVRQAKGRILLEDSAPLHFFFGLSCGGESHPPRFTGSCLWSSRIARCGRKLPWDRNFRSQWQRSRSRFFVFAVAKRHGRYRDFPVNGSTCSCR